MCGRGHFLTKMYFREVSKNSNLNNYFTVVFPMEHVLLVACLGFWANTTVSEMSMIIGNFENITYQHFSV